MTTQIEMKSEMQKDNARCIVVLGSGRSGTSAVTRILNIHGVSIGNSLVPPKEDNPRGFWEHKEIVAVHEKFLQEMNSYWDDIRPLPDRWWEGQRAQRYQQEITKILRRDFKDSSLWCIKDPRISRLLKLWHPVFREMKLQPHFVLTFRNPLDVAASLYKVGKLSKEKSLMLWLLRTIESEVETRSYPRVFVSYEEFLYDWYATMASISDTLDMNWPINTDDVSDKIDHFITPASEPYSARDKALEKDTEIPQYVKNIYHCLKSSKKIENAKLYEIFSAAGENIQAEANAFMVKAFVDDLCSRNHIHNTVQTKLKEHIVLKEAELFLCEERLRKIKESTFWRVTKPVRKIYNRFHEMFYRN